MRLFPVLGAVVFAASSIASHASLIGDSVHTRYLDPTSGTVELNFGTATVTNGLTYNEPYVSLTYSAFQITITNLSPGAFNSVPFNGFDVALLTGTPFTSVTYDPLSSALFSPGSVLSFSANDISLNLAGTCSACKGGEKIILDVNPAVAVTPEPSSLALLGTGILGAAGIIRRRISA